MKIPDLQNWRTILLDTTVIINALHALNGSQDEVCNLSLGLIRFLSKNKTTKNQDRVFLVSAITISEILQNNEGDEKIVKKVVRAIDSKNVEIISFDERIAEYMKSNYHELLGVKNQNKIIPTLNIDQRNFVQIREWITKDLMILATGHYSEADVILTNDHKTMYELSKKVDVFCALTRPHFFDVKGENFFTYERIKADKELGFE